MAIRKKKKNNFIPLIIIVVIILLLCVIIVISKNKRNTVPTNPEEIAKINERRQEEKNERVKKDLYGKSEQERMQYYCGEFFKLVDNNSYERAYELLYDTYKENYFPNINNFKRYFEEYFPSDFGLSYTNIERLGDIYVLMVNVKDTVNGSYGKNFDMYVVLKENALNDYDISFSRNSAVREGE